MQRIVITIMILTIALIVAACGSEGDEPLPTVMNLSTQAESEPTEAEANDPTPTQEGGDSNSAAQPDPSNTPEPAGNDAQPADEADSEIGNPELPIALPPIFGNGTPSGNSGGNALPFTSPDTNQWRVTSEAPVPLYECPDVECEVLDMVEDGEELQVILINEEWLTVLNETQQVFIQREFAESGAEGVAGLPAPLNPDSASAVIPSLREQLSQTPPPPQDDNALPPGIAIVTSTPGGIDLPSILATAAAQQEQNDN